MWGSRLYITYKFAHCPSSSSSQLTLFSYLQAPIYFLSLFAQPPTTNYFYRRCSSQPPTTSVLSIQRLLSQFPGKLLLPATMSAAVGMDFPHPIPSPLFPGALYTYPSTLYPRSPSTTVLYSVHEEIRTQ